MHQFQAKLIHIKKKEKHASLNCVILINILENFMIRITQKVFETQ